MIEVHADGAHNPVLGQGGWAAVLIEDSQKRVFSGAAKRTTNNRMELTAALEGILRTPQGSEVTVFTDSQYLFGTMTRGWQRRVNRDLWERLDEAIAHRNVRWQWIQGDSGNPFHKEAHTVATNLVSKGEAPPPQPARKERPAPKVRMVDVSPKPITLREAQARALVRMAPETLRLITAGEVAKGDVLATAQVAAIMAAKRTPGLIPLCHPLPLDQVQVECQPRPQEGGVEVRAAVRGEAKTGYEMEALMAVAIGALTIYDMCKAHDPAMTIEIKLLKKSGGKSGTVDLG